MRPDNVVLSMTYDAAKRLTQRTIGNEDIYNYTYNLRDELTSISNGTGTVTTVYDSFGRKTTDTVNGQASTYQYNMEDEITQIVSLEVTQNHQFDNRGLLSQLEVSGSTYQYTYDALGQLTGLNRSTATNTVLLYDVANQLSQINHGTGQRSHQNNNAQFDVANRITEDNSFTYTYDVNGNRTQKTNKTTGQVERYTYNSLDQLTRYQAYPDNNPNTVPTTDYNYAYGPIGRRWLKTNNLAISTTQFYWSDSDLIGESTNGIVRRYILDGLTPIGFIENNQIYHYLKDRLGTGHEIIDASGTTVWQGDYQSFGELSIVVNTMENNLRFPGQYNDNESELYYNHYRYYDSSLGSYITPDPRGVLLDFSDPHRQLSSQAGISIPDSSYPFGLNEPYNYANQDPIYYTDPTGEIAFVPILVGIGLGIAFDFVVDQMRQANCKCPSGFGGASTAGNAALGGANGLFGPYASKPRTGLGGGGPSGSGTSSFSQMNHAAYGRGAYGLSTRNKITRFGRGVSKRLPYVSAAVGAYQLYNAATCN